MAARRSAKICKHCSAAYSGWAASKYCGVQCRILAVSRPAENGCRNWLGRKSLDGRGKLNFNQKTFSAPRLAFEAWCGPIPAGKCVCHTCDNPSCVNPDHLFLGTDADNAADKIAKGRQPRGVEIPTAKLTERLVKEIRASSEPSRALARKYCVDHKTLRQVRARRTWRHVA